MHPIHPILVHFPIALLTASVIFDMLALRWRSDSFRDASFYTLIGGVGGALLSVISGNIEKESLKQSFLLDEVLQQHEVLGIATLWIFIGLLVVRLLMRRGKLKERPPVYVALGAFGIVVLTVAGYFGGSLVYEFGAGVTISSKSMMP